MSYYDFHIKSLGFSHYHMNKPPFSLHYLKIFPQSNMAKTLNIYHFRPFHTIAPGVGSRLCLLWRNRGARHQQRRLECPAFFCCPDMGLFENKMPPHRLLKKSQFLFKLFWDSVFIFSHGQVRCVFPLFWGMWVLVKNVLQPTWAFWHRLKALQQYIAAAYPTLDATQQAGAQRSGFPHQAIKGWNKMLQSKLVFFQKHPKRVHIVSTNSLSEVSPILSCFQDSSSFSASHSTSPTIIHHHPPSSTIIRHYPPSSTHIYIYIYSRYMISIFRIL